MKTKQNGIILLLDIGNTNTHLGLGDGTKVSKQADISTRCWFGRNAEPLVRQFVGTANIVGATLCSVVPQATPTAVRAVDDLFQFECLVLNATSVTGLGIEYPKPATIGPDRLANAIAARHRFGAPVVVVDFGTAVTFDVVNAAGNYAGGIIAPGLAAMTEYLHEKTALLPRIQIKEVKGSIGKSTEQAMLIGAVHGYRGLIRELIREVKAELRAKSLPVVATGGYAKLISSKLPEISAVDPLLTLEGLRLAWREAKGSG